MPTIATLCSTVERNPVARNQARSFSSSIAPAIFLAPTFLGFFVGILLPFLALVVFSTLNWWLLGSAAFVAGDNFVQLANSAKFNNSISVTVQIALWATVFQTAWGYLLGYSLASWTKTSRIFSGVFLLPWMAAPLAIGIIWKWILSPTGGFLSQFLAFRVDFLSSPMLSQITVAGVSAWAGSGFTALVVASAIRTVPQSTVQAACLDGASAWQIFWSIQLPQIRRVTFFLIATTFLAGMTIYDLVVSLSGTGPSFATDVATFHIVSATLSNFSMGESSAMALVFTGFELLLLSLLYMSFKLVTRRFDDK